MTLLGKFPRIPLLYNGRGQASPATVHSGRLEADLGSSDTFHFASSFRSVAVSVATCFWIYTNLTSSLCRTRLPKPPERVPSIPSAPTITNIENRVHTASAVRTGVDDPTHTDARRATDTANRDYHIGIASFSTSHKAWRGVVRTFEWCPTYRPLRHAIRWA